MSSLPRPCIEPCIVSSPCLFRSHGVDQRLNELPPILHTNAGPVEAISDQLSEHLILTGTGVVALPPAFTVAVPMPFLVSLRAAKFDRRMVDVNPSVNFVLCRLRGGWPTVQDSFPWR